MGADFCYATIPICDLTEARRAKLIKEFTDQDNSTGNLIDLLLDEYEMFRVSREVAMIYINNHFQCWITGGMSWGDAPTEAYVTMCNLDEYDGLWDRLKGWCAEDIRARNKRSNKRKDGRGSK